MILTVWREETWLVGLEQIAEAAVPLMLQPFQLAGEGYACAPGLP